MSKETGSLKECAREIFLETIRQIDPIRLITDRVKLQNGVLIIDDQQIDLTPFNLFVVIGFGKASLKMASAIEHILGDRITAGIVVTNALHDDVELKHSEVIVGGHPYPNHGSWQVATRAIELVKSADERTLIIYLVSGGGSALFERPLGETITLDDLREMNRLLVTCGATIREMNAIRKHLSAVKGGRLAAFAPRSLQISFYISDVNRDDLSTIASDPTGPDDTTLADFHNAIQNGDLLSRLPVSIKKLVADREVPETPKGDNEILRSVKRVLLMDNAEMLAMAARLAVESGWQTDIDFGNNEEHYRIVADRLLLRLKELSDKNPDRSVCLIAGGEVSCPVTGKGRGGRNQEFALYCATKIKGMFSGCDVAVLSAGTDGIDGNSVAAGTVVNEDTLTLGGNAGLDANDFIERNDSYNYFAQLGDSIETGPTGTNVRDLRIFLLRPMGR